MRGLTRHRGRSRVMGEELFATDHADSRQVGRFRWLFSTCLAAAVGTIAIVVVIYGSMDHTGGPEGIIPTFTRLSEAGESKPLPAVVRRRDGLRWVVPRSDRLEVNTGATSTRYIIRESRTERRGGRKYTAHKPYLRLVARLAPVPADFDDVIPPFNPFKLYASAKPVGSGEDGDEGTSVRADVQVKVVELLGGTLPNEDGQMMEPGEVLELVEKSLEPEKPLLANGPDDMAGDAAQQVDAKAASLLVKNVLGSESEDEDIEGRISRAFTAIDGDTLTKILMRAGAETWQARTMVEAASSIFPDAGLQPGEEVRVTLVPSLTHQNSMEPVRFSVYNAKKAHKVSVMRDASGEYVSSAMPPRQEIKVSASPARGGDQSQSNSLYASVYHAGLTQHLAPDTINQILRVHAYETDFRRRLRAGDAVEFFFDVKDENDPDGGSAGELLYTAVTAGGDTTRFYRYRTRDGQSDFYDANGNNSKRFLMRRPVRGDDVRLTSGFGFRLHPLLNEKRMHTGVDWATTPGTPILAAGNGVIEEAGRKGQYGNYVRIRHANGYQTAYGHMQRIGDGVVEGVKVRQGQVIGFVGSTGMSSGPHLHFEVLVNTRFVDPLAMQVPRERQLEGRELLDFQRERARIDDLMRRAPVRTASK
ncbi:MAG: M23 family metallopeptidase [Hyphomicrobiaceae bacterium]|nr:M23 family metallopeptidase [Hyphomicrobiaceae bacterium]